MIENSLKKLIALGIIATSVLAINPIGASAEWKQDSTGWWYAENNSWATGLKEIGGKNYYFDSKGYMKIGWLQDGDSWRYFYSNGEMAHDTVIDGCVINAIGIWVKDITPDEEEYFKNLAYQAVNDVYSSEKIVFDGCYTKENYPYKKILESMNIKDDIIYMYKIVPQNGKIEYEPPKVIIGKDSKNVYEATGGVDLSQWKNKQKVKTFKYIG